MKAVNFIPKELETNNRWGFGDLNKRPINAITFELNKPNEKDCWVSIADARKSYIRNKDKQDNILGLGYCIFKDDNIVCIDIDHCIENGVVSDFAQSIIDRFKDTYIEKSQSGTGLHIFAKGNIPNNIKTDIEMYCENHYMVFTGDTINHNEIIDYTNELQKLFNEHNKTKEIVKETKEIDFNNMYSIIDKIRSIPITRLQFDKYYNGNCESNSENTFAFACMLAFWTNKNRSMIRSIMLNSGICREKCFRKTKNGDWLDLVIEKAIDSQISVYTPSIKNEYIEDTQLIVEKSRELELMEQDIDKTINEIEYPTEINDRVLSNIIDLDEMVGGFTFDSITLWSGTTNSGKSTLLGQICRETIRQGNKVWYFAGEHQDSAFKKMLYNQMARQEQLDFKRYKNTNIGEYVLKPQFLNDYNLFFNNNIILYMNNAPRDIDTMIRSMERAYNDEGVRVFFIDNLMQIDQITQNQNKEETSIVEKLRTFTTIHPAHIHLVAHPRKMLDNNIRLTMFDISGSLNIVNKCYNMISIIRKDQLRQDTQEYDTLRNYVYYSGYDFEQTDCILEVLKYKYSLGRTGIICLKYDKITKTFKLLPKSDYSMMITTKKNKAL